MFIYLVRHGEAVPEEQDPLRPLSTKGKDEVEKTAGGLREQGTEVDEIWHSGKLRAKQTAEIIAKALNVSRIIEKKGLQPYDPVAPIAKQLSESGKHILIVGHNPFLLNLDSFLLLGTGEEEPVELGTGGVMRVGI